MNRFLLTCLVQFWLTQIFPSTKSCVYQGVGVLYWLPFQIFRTSTGSAYHHLCMALKYCHIVQKNVWRITPKKYANTCKELWWGVQNHFQSKSTTIEPRVFFKHCFKRFFFLEAKEAVDVDEASCLLRPLWPLRLSKPLNTVACTPSLLLAILDEFK